MFMMITLIISKKKPRVRMVTGNVKTIRTGFTILLSKASARATSTAVI